MNRRNLMELGNMNMIRKYAKYYIGEYNKINDLRKVIILKNLPIVLWGAGAKGCAFLRCFDKKNEWIDYVIDVDINKQGTKLETGHIIEGINAIKKEAIILVVNVKFYSSICFSLFAEGYDVKTMKILSLDDYIQDRISLQSIQDDVIWIRRKYYD